MTKDIMTSVGEMLINKKLTIAFAESATAGRLCADFSMIENAGTFLKGGIACYDASIKESLLEVNTSLVEKYTPESMEVTRAIAKGLSIIIPADIHVGITGLTCPGGSETEEKPVGTMFIYALLYGDLLFSERLVFQGDPLQILSGTVDRFAELLQMHLLNV